MKRIEKNPFKEDQTLDYPHQDIRPLDPDETDASKTRVFRFRWASNNIDALLGSGFEINNHLEIGASDGFMAVIVAKKRNSDGSKIHVDALEPHNQSFWVLRDTVDISNSKGLDMSAYCLGFEKFSPERKYELVTAFEILEHSKDPQAFIDKIYDLLNEGGVLLLSVPEEHGRYGVTDTNPYHYWLFNIQSLSALFREDRWRIYQAIESYDLINLLARKETQ